MKQKQFLLGLAPILEMLFALLVLFWRTRVPGWKSGWDQAGKWRERRRNPQDGAQGDAGMERLTTGIGRLWPSQPVVWHGSFLTQRDRSGEQEWMDLPNRDPRELAEMFKDLRRVNHWLGGRQMTVRGLERLLSDRHSGEHITILDVASGSVDIPRVMSRWSRHHKVSIVATDINPEVLKLAKESGSPDTIQLVAADALRLPFANDAFDIAACSFFLHHLDPDDVVIALSEMRRVSQSGVLINDMIRGWTSYIGAWTFSHAFTRNRISRHDAPLSARRSYTRNELIELAARAGLEPLACYGFFGYRMMMVTTDRSTAPESTPQKNVSSRHVTTS
jgi:ubiquinone/menaquinone biosynthesis C-methylase UbiE